MLPNITGTINYFRRLSCTVAGATVGTGALRINDNTEEAGAVTISSNIGKGLSLSLDASRLSSIYKNGGNVVVTNISAKYWLRTA